MCPSRKSETLYKKVSLVWSLKSKVTQSHGVSGGGSNMFLDCKILLSLGQTIPSFLSMLLDTEKKYFVDLSSGSGKYSGLSR